MCVHTPTCVCTRACEDQRENPVVKPQVLSTLVLEWVVHLPVCSFYFDLVLSQGLSLSLELTGLASQ